MTASRNGGTLAVGDAIVFQILRDGLPFGGQERVGAVAVGADVAASAEVSFIDTVTPGGTHTYAIRGTVVGGHTAGVLIAEAAIVVIDL
jgi:hypothetical protein